MAEIRPLQLESQRVVGNRPSFGQFAPIGPVPFFLIASVEAGVGLCPSVGVGLLERLGRRARPVERDLAESLQPPAAAEIEKLVFVRRKHYLLRFAVFRCGR